MSTPAAQVARSYVAPGTVWDVARNRDHTTGAGKLIPQDLGATTDRPGLWLQWAMLAGWPVAHGEVADEATMLALHTFAMDSGDNPLPRYVAPGDSCTRTDDPGWRWYCLSGHGALLSDWERRPLAGALEGIAVEGHTHAISDVTGLQSALDSKQATLANATALGKISEAGGLPTWNGATWPGGGGSGSTFTPQSLPSLAAWYKADAGLLKSDGSAAAAGDAVATWQDQSGGSNHLAQATGARQPILTANAIGTHAAPRFDGVDDYMLVTTGPTVALANCTIVAFVRSMTSDPSKRFVVLGPVGSSGTDYDTPSRAMLGQGSGSNYCYFWSGNTSVSIAGAKPAPVGAYVGRIRNSILQLSDNDTVWSGTASASGLGNAVGILLAAYYAAGTVDPTLGLNGYIAEVCVYSRALTAYEIGQLVAYLNGRWS